METKNEKPAPIQQSVHVDCPVEDAFQIFTERFAEWWPLALYSVSGQEAESCDIEPWTGGRVLERTRSGEEHDWGSVTLWDPPRRLEFTWHPDLPDDGEQTVAVEFGAEADGTRVTVTHYGWQTAGVATCAWRGGAAPEWESVLLLRFVSFVCEQILIAA